MQPLEWVNICNTVVKLWGPSRAWETAKEHAYNYAQILDADVGNEIVNDLMLEGHRRPPSPSEVISKIRNRGGILKQNSTVCRHPDYAIFESHSDGSAAQGMCAACHKEHTWPPGVVYTMGDLKERANLDDYDERLAL